MNKIRKKGENMFNLIPFFPETLYARKMYLANGKITIEIEACQIYSVCPKCKSKCYRFHSHYTRKLMDLPILGCTVYLVVACRKLFCDNPQCERKIFTERFDRLIFPYARCTERLKAAMEAVAFATNARTGGKLSTKLGMPMSHDFLLDAIKNTNIEIRSNFQVIGVDDFAFRKGNRYGTIVYDHIEHKPIDLLADRSCDTLEKWLREHPGTKIVTRDRSKTYAKAINDACPDAVQIADRFHLLKNLLDVLKEFIKIIFTLRIKVPAEPTKHIEIPKDIQELPKQQKLPQNKKRQAEAREKKKILVCQVKEFHQKGIPIREIARQMRLSRRTVKRYVQLDEEKAATYCRGKCYSKLDSYRSFIVSEAIYLGKKAANVFRSIIQMGYKGADSTVRYYIRKLRSEYPTNEKLEIKDMLLVTSPEQWIKRSDLIHCLWAYEHQLKADEKIILAKVLEQSSMTKTIYGLVQKFRQIINTRNVEELNIWIKQAQESEIPQIVSFAQGLESDKEEVQNALLYPYSNGPVEGNINRLKMIKRLMYGRAKLPLLKKRVLYKL